MAWGSIPLQVAEQRAAEIAELLRSNPDFGECFNERYKGTYRTKDSTKEVQKTYKRSTVTQESILQAINPQMHLTRDFFKLIYSFELRNPGFAKKALLRLEGQGCSRARDYYKTVVESCEKREKVAMQEAGKYLQKNTQKGDDKKRSIKDMSNSRLLTFAKNL